MRVYTLALIMFLMVGLFFILGSIEFVTVAERVAAVKEIRGTVQVTRRRTGRKMLLHHGDKVQTGDRIKTGPDGRVRLHWLDDYELLIKPNSDLTVNRISFNPRPKATNSLFFLHMGEVLSTLKRKLNRRSRFELRTPVVTAAVRGTVFETKVDKSGATQITVLRGAVSLVSVVKQERIQGKLNKSQEVTLKSGKTAHIDQHGVIHVQ